MLEKPALPDEKIVACLRESYGVIVARLEFLPIGYDPNAGVYRVTTDNGGAYFLKVKKGGVDRASLAVPRYLNDQGIVSVVAPILTRSQQFSAEIEPFAAILYPFIEGQTVKEAGMVDDQWIALGAAVRRMHTLLLPPDLAQPLPRENFIPKATNLVRRLDNRIADRSFVDPFQNTLAASWQRNRAAIRLLVDQTEAFGGELRNRSHELVLCHADIHSANLLVDQTGHFYIVDWDAAMLAPKERDLMFATGLGAGWAGTYGEHANNLFKSGYGQTDFDMLTLAYYHSDWVIQDIGDFGKQVFSPEENGDEARADALRLILGSFGAGSTVETALHSL